MSVEMHVLFRGQLPSKAALQRAMRDLGFPFTIKPARGSLETQRGFMPMMLRQEETGVEFDVFDGRDAVDEVLPNDDAVDPTLDRRASLRWSGDFTEAVAGMCVAAALAKLVHGRVLDESDEDVWTAEKAVEIARRNLAILTKERSLRGPGTSPSDIRRYLKPLLELRPDLALVGRCLIVRPVRHVMRGVLLDRTRDRYTFRVWRYYNPLYADTGTLGYGGEIFGHWQVYEPHFQPMLFDVLSEDVFADLGRMTSLGDFAARLEGRQLTELARILAHILAGQRDRAAALAADMEKHEWFRSTGRMDIARRLLARDTGELCAEFREREAANAKELALGDIWQPARFPVELPEHERANCDEPAFVPAPWIEPPPRLWEEFPENIGEIRFSEFTRRRKGRLILYRPLSREQAGEHHRTSRSYVLAGRLSPDVSVVMHVHGGWSPYDPGQPTLPEPPPFRSIRIGLSADAIDLSATFRERSAERGIMSLTGVEADDGPSGKEILNIVYNDIAQERTVRDRRPGGNEYARDRMSEADLALTRCAVPEFGDFESLLGRVTRCVAAHGIAISI